ncbi:TPA: hypothetical protein ACKRMM_005947 [Pseudomonas aeruginosa]
MDIKVVGIKKISDDMDLYNQNKHYYELFMEPIRKCKDYKPKLGGNDTSGVDINKFKEIYGGDPFYSWIGLDSPLMYAAHKAAGGMTSIYRQIGIGCERLFREILFDTCLYEDKKYTNWSYDAITKSGKKKTLYLDGRLEINAIKSKKVIDNLNNWLDRYCSEINVEKPKKGIVFEVRQGYKSKDSKRQNADIDNATVAWANNYLPIFAIFSAQIDKDIFMRYINNRCGILCGIDDGNDCISLFSFIKNILGFDIADFFISNSKEMKEEMNIILSKLLTAK